MKNGIKVVGKKNTIEVIPWNTQYSIIKVEKQEHIVSNHGWVPLDYWTKYFMDRFEGDKI